jgi:hypothetical protein
VWEKIVTDDEKKPPSRHFHSALEFHNNIFIFGGKSNGYLNDLWIFNTSLIFECDIFLCRIVYFFFVFASSVTREWKLVENDDAPPRRYGHSAVIHDKIM